MKTARVLISERCNRDCSYCCNKQEGILDNMTQVPFWFEWEFFKSYEVICVTGGEPMLFPEGVIMFADRVKSLYKDMPVYMYSAQYTKKMEEVLKHIDGVHFTIHENPSSRDIIDFHKFQELIAREENYGKSFRLYVNPSIDQPLHIIPALWKRVEIAPWKEECPLPENETLFKWSEY